MISVGVFLLAARFPGQDEGEVLRAATATAVAAEAVGFDGAWVAEHHFMSYGLCPSAVTLAAHLLGRTTRIEVGTAVSVLSVANPVALGEQTALLDQVSAGRFRLGVGRGGPWRELEVLGSDLDRYEHGFAEALDLLLDWLNAPSVGRAGGRFPFRPVPVVPRPRTRPRPEVVVACTSTPTLELAAERGLPMLLGMDLDDEAKAAMVRRYAELARRHGHDPAGVPHMAAAVAQVAEDGDAARALLRRQMPTWLETGLAGYVRVDDKPVARKDPVDYTRMLCDIHPVGDPELCARRLRTTARRTGITRFILLVEGAGELATTLENVRLLGAQVLPALR